MTLETFGRWLPFIGLFACCYWASKAIVMGCRWAYRRYVPPQRTCDLCGGPYGGADPYGICIRCFIQEDAG